MSEHPTIKVLALRANPLQTKILLLKGEIHEIKEELDRTVPHHCFKFHCGEESPVHDIPDILLPQKPDILYISGHGNGEQGIVTSVDGKVQIFSEERLNNLFKWAKRTVKCVFLNGCYLPEQGQTINQHVDCVIGTNHAIDDQAAIKFATKFFRALADRESFQSAYELSCLTLDSMNSSQELASSILLNKVEIENPLGIPLPSSKQDKEDVTVELQVVPEFNSLEKGDKTTADSSNYNTITQASENAVVTQEENSQNIKLENNTVSGQFAIGRDIQQNVITNIITNGIKNVSQFKPRGVVLLSSGIGLFIILIRFMGFLQPLELWFYDRLLRTQADLSEVDKRLLVIGITKADYEAQKEEEAKGGGELIGSISNEKLTELLEKLDQLEPLAIGLDIYREEPIEEEKFPELLNRFRTQENLFAVCKGSDISDVNSSEAKAPDGFPPDRIGFSDFVPLDKDGQVLRRHLLAFKPESNSLCQSTISFNLRLANAFLEKKNIKFEEKKLFPDDSYCQDLTFSNGVAFRNFMPYTGGYQGTSSNDISDYEQASTWGCQVLLKFRKGKIQEGELGSFASRGGAENISLMEFLSDDFPINSYKERIVLVGVVRSDGGNDYWSTPLSDRQIPGVMLQAQMVSQIIDAASKESSLIQPFSQGIEALLILAASLLGGCLGFRLSEARNLFKIIGAIVVVFGASCFVIFFVASKWLPFIPATIAVVVSSTVIGLPRSQKFDPELIPQRLT